MISDKLPDVRNAEVAGKRVFLRADIDVPLLEVRSQKLEVRQIEDDMRLVAGMPTIKHLLENKARVIIGGHLGRPGEKNQKSKIKNQNYGSEFSLMSVAEWLVKNFNFPFSNLQFQKIDGLSGWRISENLFLLENLRFYQGEEKNDPDFAKQLANLADLYVNDAFAMCHRNHASIVGVPKLLPHYAGIRLIEEVKHLSSVLDNPKRPLIVIIGGKKIETKLPLVEKTISLADKVLVGGLIAKEMRKQVQHDKIEVENLFVAKLNNDGTDILEESLNEFISIIKTAGTVVWNGPMGLINQKSKIKNQKLEDTERGTKELAKAIVESSAYKVVGGGDTTEFLKRIGLLDKFDFVSTGGGAMLTFLSGQPLPGLEALLE